MKINIPNLKKFTLVLLMLNLFFSNHSIGQTTIVSDGLNNSTSHFTLSGGAYYSGNSASGDRPATSPFASEGTHGRGVSNNTATLTSTNNINTSSYSNIKLSIRLAAFSIGTSSNGLDQSDDVQIRISTNGGSNYTTILTVRGPNNDNAYWSYSASGIATTNYPTTATFASSNSGNRTTDGYSTLNINSLPASSTLKIQIILDNSSNSERWVVDDFKITGCQNAAAGTDQVKCNNGSFTLAANTASAGSGAWSLVSGTATIGTASSPTSNITGVPIGTSATLRWTITNGTCSTTDDVIITNTTTPATPGAITVPSNVCSGTSGNSFSIAAVPNATSYNWSVTGTGWSIPVSSSTTSVNVNVGSGIGTLTVTATNTCGTSLSSTTGNITPNTIPTTPLAITQPTNKCASTSGNTFSISPVSNTTSYTWTVTGTGWSIPVASTTTTVNVTIGSGVGTVTVRANNGCGSSPTQTTGSITPLATPLPGTITQPTNKCASTSDNIFSIAAVPNATSYTWSVTGTGWSIPVASTSTSVNVTIGTGVGTVSVSQTNVCGTSTARSTGNITPTTPPSSLNYSQNPAEYCVGSDVNSTPTISGSSATYIVSPALPSGLTLNSSTGVIMGVPSAITAAGDYTITATNACGSTQKIINIAIKSNNLEVIAGSTCGSGTVNLSANSSGCFTSTLNWYSALTGGSSLASGSSYSPSVSSSTDFYVEEKFVSSEAPSGSDDSNSTNRGLAFDLYEPIVLNSVVIRSVSGSGNITISLQNSSGGPVSGVSPVTIVNPSNSSNTTATLNWSIPAGNGYRILYTSGSRSLRRTDNYSFPTGIEVGSITGNVDSFASDRYNFFYNWNISRVRVMVSATVNPSPTVSVNSEIVCAGNNATISATPGSGNIGDYSYAWTVPVGATNPGNVDSFTTTVAGNYSVIITNIATTCTSVSSGGTVTVIPILTPTFTTILPICAGGNLSPLSTTSINGIEGSWSPSLNNLATTTYTFTPNIGQCGASTTMQIVVENNCPTVMQSSCSVTLDNLNGYLYSTIVRYAQGYRWRVTNLATNEVQTADTPLRQFRVIMLPNFAYNTNYQVEVAVKLAGVWGAFSNPCPFSTGVPTTQMVICAGTPSTMSTQNSCNIVQFAKGYRFEMTDGLDTQTFDNVIRQFSLSQLNDIVSGTTYDVRVAVQNTDGSFMAYGPTCTITAPGAAATATTKFARTSSEVVSSDLNVVSFPNPFANSFAVKISSISQEKVQIKVYDMVGRLVEQRNTNISELESTQIGNNYQSGIYNIIVSQGENIQTLKVIKR